MFPADEFISQIGVYTVVKAAVFSDTHGLTSLMLDAARSSGAEVLIHLGDHDSDADVLRRELPDKALYAVRGNCDMCSFAPDFDVVPLGSVKAFITHGHLYSVRYGNLDSLVYAAQEQGCTLALFGHTHRAELTELGGVTVLNPGTAGKGREPTWALIETFPNGGIACDIRPL